MAFLSSTISVFVEYEIVFFNCTSEVQVDLLRHKKSPSTDGLDIFSEVEKSD